MSEQQQKNPKQKVVGGLFWSFGERICAQLVTLIVGIILARILSPDDYGVISIVMVFNEVMIRRTPKTRITFVSISFS